MSLTQPAKIQIDVMRLCEEVQHCPCLYDGSLTHNRDVEGNCKEFGSEWKCLLNKVEIFKRQIREDEEEAAAEEKKLCNLASAPHIYSLMGWLQSPCSRKLLISAIHRTAQQHCLQRGCHLHSIPPSQHQQLSWKNPQPLRILFKTISRRLRRLLRRPKVQGVHLFEL